jgi:drug/metabolite transporter (DMT)-like permease
MNAKTWGLIGLLSLIWGVPYFLIKISLAELSPACVAWGRVTVGALILLPIARQRGALRNIARSWRGLLAFACCEVVAPFFLIASGERFISSSLTAILIAMVPLLVIVFSPFFGRAEPMDLRKSVGLALGFFGLIVLLGFEGLSTTGELAGAAMILLAAVGYAVGPLIAEHHLKGIDSIGTIAVALSISSIFLAMPAFLTAPATWPSAQTLGAVATLGWLCSAIALVLFVTIIGRAGAYRASLIAYLAPTVAVLLGVVALDENFGVTTVVGMALIFGGSWLATMKTATES